MYYEKQQKVTKTQRKPHIQAVGKPHMRFLQQFVFLSISSYNPVGCL
uniref:Uncharacterized protein n=1 Tax=Anguilla anguilla TaxID=7936 RepID=A0A0E9TFH1_ANGAN